MKSIKRLAGDVFATFAKLAGLVDDTTDTKTDGHKMAALSHVFATFKVQFFTKRIRI